MPINTVGYVEHVTDEGDTFDVLALMYYNEEKMMSYIIEANIRYAGVLVFKQGIKLQIPVLDSVETPETLPPWRRLE